MIKSVIKLLFLFAICGTVQADTGRASFVGPTARVDGSDLPMNEIAGHDAFLDGVRLDNPKDSDAKYTLVNSATEMTFTAPPGTYELTFVTYDTDGRESTLSEAVTVTAKAPPNTFTDIVVNVSVTIVVTPLIK